LGVRKRKKRHKRRQLVSRGLPEQRSGTEEPAFEAGQRDETLKKGKELIAAARKKNRYNGARTWSWRSISEAIKSVLARGRGEATRAILLKGVGLEGSAYPIKRRGELGCG